MVEKTIPDIDDFRLFNEVHVDELRIEVGAAALPDKGIDFFFRKGIFIDPSRRGPE